MKITTNAHSFPLYVSFKRSSTGNDVSEQTNFKTSYFIQKVRQVIEENIDDETFGIPELCRAVGISRSQLHNKIKAQSGLSTSIFIRNIRLEKAKQILSNTELNISEVAYEVGFKDPSYFSRLFTERYGISPKKMRTEKGLLRIV